MTYDDLTRCPALVRELAQLSQLCAWMRGHVEGHTSHLGGGARGGTPLRDRMGDGIAELLDTEALWSDKAVQLRGHIEVVEAELAGLADPDARTVLRLRYIQGLTWEEIAQAIHYSERWCRTMHGRALTSLGL